MLTFKTFRHMPAPVTAVFFSTLVFAAAPVQIPVTPIAFEPNAGQLGAPHSDIKYLAHISGTTLWMSEQGVALAGIGIRFAHGAAHPKIEPEEPQPGISNYFIGKDRSKWRTDVPHYAKVRYRDVYPGIDAVFYGNPGKLEYDFVVRPGADPSRIALVFDGVSSVATENGNLVAKTAAGAELGNLRPAILQDGKRIGGRWVVRGKNIAGFAVDAYDPKRPLTIDPVLTYASLLGGSTESAATAVAIDGQGNIIVAGFTSAGFSTKNALYPTFNASDAEVGFVAKFNPSASGAASLVYSTYFGTFDTVIIGGDLNALAADQAGDAYIGGDVSDGLPAVNAFPGQATYNATTNCVNYLNGVLAQTACLHGFITEFSPKGDQILFSTYLEGSREDSVNAMTLDAAGNLDVTGYTYSPDFPITGGATQSDILAGGTVASAFITQITPARQIAYSTFIGTSFGSTGSAIAADTAGNIYICGLASGVLLPVSSGAFRPTNPAAATEQTGFVTVVNPTQQPSLVYGTYLGGTMGNTFLNGIAADKSGNIYLTGTNGASDFPVTPGLEAPSAQDIGEALVVKLNPSAQGSAQLAYSTIVDGSFGSEGNGIAVDSAGRMWIAGNTVSPDFPVTANAFQPYYTGLVGSSGFSSIGYLAQFDPSQPGVKSLLYSTLLGGTGAGSLNAIALGPGGTTLAVAGEMTAANSPVTVSAAQSAPGDGENGSAYVAVFNLTQTGPLITTIENGASLSQDPFHTLSPGMIVTLKGAGLGPSVGQGGAIDPTTGRVSTNVAGVQVLINNVPCPLLYLSATQINAVVPYEVAKIAGVPVAVQVAYNGMLGNVIYVNVSATQPGIFSFDDGSGQGAILNQDSSVNGANNAAARGTVIQIFATGEGQTNPPGVDGAIASEPVSGIPTPLAALSLTIGGVAVTNIAYAGTLPGGVAGALQINATIPANAPTGSAVPVVLTIGANSSPKTLTMAVK